METLFCVCACVCVKGCLSWQSHPGPTGLLITFSVTWHLLRENDRASTANMDIAALSLSLVSVDPSCRLALRLLDSIYMYDWFNTWTVLFMTSGPSTQTQSQTRTHTFYREKHPSWQIFNQPWDSLRCPLCSSRLGHFLSSCWICCSGREKKIWVFFSFKRRVKHVRLCVSVFECAWLCFLIFLTILI